MLFSRAEMDILRLCALCKDLPLDTVPEVVCYLAKYKFLRISRCGCSYRLTPRGYLVLQKAGYDCKPDRQYLGQGAALCRRLQTAATTTFFWRYGADVFSDTVPAKMDRPVFLPSFVYRRNPSTNFLGATRMDGFFYTADTVWIPYTITPESERIYADAEQRVFRSNLVLQGKSPAVLYIGTGSYEQLVTSVAAPRAKNIHAADTYREALSKFACPSALITMDDVGMHQLQILSAPHYAERLLRAALGSDYTPVAKPGIDGQSRSAGEPYIVGIDGNFVRFADLAAQCRNTLHILLLPSHIEAVGRYLCGQNVCLHPVEPSVAEFVLGLPDIPPPLRQEPYQNAKGEYAYVPFVR